MDVKDFTKLLNNEGTNRMLYTIQGESEAPQYRASPQPPTRTGHQWTSHLTQFIGISMNKDSYITDSFLQLTKP